MSASVQDVRDTVRTGGPAPVGAMTRLLSLGRAELTLLGRNKSALYTSLVIPFVMGFAMKQAIAEMPLGSVGLTVGTMLLPATLGYVLLFGIYSTLTGAYVARREELVLKRLRTGELRDREILAGTALPSVLLGLVQCVILVALGDALLDAGFPTSPHFLIAGLALGLMVVVGFAAVSSCLAKSTEAAQIAVLPFMLVSLMGSGMVVPLGVVPGVLGDVLGLLPMSPVMELIRAGWTGGGSAKEMVGHLLTGLAWSGIALFAVQRWFRWEPRR